MAMEERFEPKVGERFNFHCGLNIVVMVMTVEGMCRDCDLFETALCGSCNLLCLPDERSDKKHVAFKRIVEWKEK